MSNAHQPAQSRPLHARYLARALPAALALVAALAGCDPHPTGPDMAGTGAAALPTSFPSSLTLEVEALAALAAYPLTGDLAAAFVDAGDLAAEADAAEVLGSRDSGLEEAADTLIVRALLGSLGQARADAVLEDVERAIADVERSFAMTSAGRDAWVRLAEARDAYARARTARAHGDLGGTALHAARAADALRWLDPERYAKAAVAAAHEIMERAKALAGAEPEAPIARALARAEEHCATARRALDAERWRLAVAEAHLCARVARAVLARLGGGLDAGKLADRAEESVAHAAALLERAVEVAGPSPEPRVAALLDEARGLLGRARVALEGERYRVAIALAVESSARSLRALRILQLGTPSPYELRAKAALEAAHAMGAKVDALISEDTPVAIVEAARRTHGVLAQAVSAYEAGDFRAAWGLARRAITIYARILNALS